MQQFNGQNTSFRTRLTDSFFRHRWLFLLSVFAITGLTTLVLKLRPETYRATAQTQVVSDKQELADALGEKEGYGYVNQAQQNVDDFNDMLGDDRPNGFIDTALKSAQLQRPISVDPRDDDPRFALLRKRLVINADSQSLFTISLTWDNPQECERIVWALQKQYIEEVGFNRQATAIHTTKFLDQEISNYGKQMEDAENALIDYKKNNGGQTPDAQAADTQQLAQLKTERDTLLISAQDSTLKRQALEARLKEIKPMDVMAQTMADGPDMLALRGLQTQRAQLIAQGNLPTGERVQDVDHEILTTQQQLKSESHAAGTPQGQIVMKTDLHNNPEYQAIESELTEAKIAERTQLAQITRINQQIQVYQARIAKIPDAQRLLNDKMRGYIFNKQQYDNLVERRQAAQLKANLDKITAQSTLLEVGTIYAEPSTTRSKRIIMFAASVIGGLLIGVIVVVFSEWSDQTLRYGEDAERILGLPLLAEVGEMRALPAPAAKGGAGGSV